MDGDPAFDALRQFLFDHVATHEELETLLLLSPEPSRDWSVESVARALGIPVDEARPALEGLALRGLLAAGGAGTFRYAPASELIARGVEALDLAYGDRRFAVIQLMSRNSVERMRTVALRTFAEAFRIRDSPNGR